MSLDATLVVFVPSLRGTFDCYGWVPWLGDMFGCILEKVTSLDAMSGRCDSKPFVLSGARRNFCSTD